MSKYSDLASCLVYISPAITYAMTFLPSCLANAFAIHFVLVGELATILKILVEEEVIKNERPLFFLCLIPKYA